MQETSSGQAIGSVWRARLAGTRSGEFALWLSSATLGLQLLERIESLYTFSKELRSVLGAWNTTVEGISEGVADGLRKLTGISVSEAYLPVVALVIQLSAIVLTAFLYFGAEPYWTRAARSKPGVPLFPRYLVNLVACLLLLYIVLRSSGLAVGIDGVPLGIVRSDGNGLEVLAPSNWLEGLLLVGATFLTALLIGWHPGVAWRILAVALLLWSVSVFALLPDVATHVWDHYLSEQL